MRNKGAAKPGAPIRWLCLVCRKYRNVHQPSAVRLRLVATEDGWLLGDLPRGMPVTEDARHRRRVHLGKWHPYANSAGWQYLARFLVMDALHRRLGPHEQVHHRDGNRLRDLLCNYEVLIPELHGRLHASAASLAGWRDELGRFVEWDARPAISDAELAAIYGPRAIERFGPVVGDAALRLLKWKFGGIDQSPDLPLSIPSAADLLGCSISAAWLAASGAV